MMMMSSSLQPRARTSAIVTGKNGCSKRPRRSLVNPVDIEGSKIALGRRFAVFAERFALVARAVGAQRAEVVDARRVAVRPVDVAGIIADDVDGARAHRGGDRRRIEQGLARHLLDALRAAAGEAQVARGVDALVVVVPDEGDGGAEEPDDLDRHRHAGNMA